MEKQLEHSSLGEIRVLSTTYTDTYITYSQLQSSYILQSSVQRPIALTLEVVGAYVYFRRL